jgi:hypothetical protein
MDNNCEPARDDMSYCPTQSGGHQLNTLMMISKSLIWLSEQQLTKQKI